MPRSWKARLLLLALLSAGGSACNFSDSIDQLGDGYFFRYEGPEIRDIHCERAKGREVPATVQAYAYDDDFIIAQQRPLLPPDLMYDAEYDYPDSNRYYFWIIDKRDDSSSGPLTFEAYEAARSRYGVPDNLVLGG